MVEAKPDDLSILQVRGFVKVFDENVLIIKDWKEHNYIRSDRYTPSKYLAVYKEELKVLSSGIPDVIPDVIPTVDVWLPQDRLGKDRLGKDRGEEKKPTPPLKRISKKKMRENAERFLQGFNQNLNTKYKALSFENNLSYWLEFYSWEDISKAVGAIKQGLWWAGSPDPTLLLRRRDKQGNPVDYIGELVELWRKKNGK